MRKKYFFLSALAVATVLTSCSQEETVSQQVPADARQDALSIRPIVNGVMRATSYDNNNLDEFRVIGSGAFKSFTSAAPTTLEELAAGTDVTRFDCTAQKTDNWYLTNEYTNGLWWADKVTKGAFTGVAPKTIAEGAYAVAGAKADEGYTAAADGRASQQDIIVAYNEGVKNDFRNGVPMKFRHVLSRIQFKGINKDAANGLVVEIRNIKLVNIASKSALTFPAVSTGDGFDWANYKPWEAATTPAWFYGTQGDAINLTATAKNITFGDDFYMLPQSLTAADAESMQAASTAKQYVSFQIRVKKGASASDLVNSFANTNGMIYPYAKNADGKFLNGTQYTALQTAGTLDGISLCTDAEWGWAAVPFEAVWQPGKQYIYTLNYSAGGVGLTDPEDGVTPGEDILPDSPVQLFFTVDVVDWDQVQDSKTL